MTHSPLSGGCSFSQPPPCPSWYFCVPVASPTSLSLLPPVLIQASSSPWNPAPAPVSSPSLLLPIPAIVFIAVGIYLLLLGLVLLTRHCLLVRDLVGAEEWALGKRNLVNLCPHLHAFTLRLFAIYLVPTSVPSVGPKSPLLFPAEPPLAPLPKTLSWLSLLATLPRSCALSSLRLRAAVLAAASPAGSKAHPGPKTVAGPVQKPATSLCLVQPTTWMPAAPGPGKL